MWGVLLPVSMRVTGGGWQVHQGCARTELQPRRLAVMIGAKTVLLHSPAILYTVGGQKKNEPHRFPIQISHFQSFSLLNNSTSIA